MVVVFLGLATLAFIAIEGVRPPVSDPADLGTERAHDLVVQRLVTWIVFVGLAALATLALGIGDLVMGQRDKNKTGPTYPPSMPDRDTDAMIDAEVNEGGPAAPVPRDKPVVCPGNLEKRRIMSDTQPTMETCPAPDRVLHLPLGAEIATATSTTLMKSEGLELLRLVIPAGKQIPAHRAPKEITVQCIEGRVSFEHDGHAIEMRPGDLLHLCPQESHAIRGIVDSSVLVTRLRPHAEELPETFPVS